MAEETFSVQISGDPPLDYLSSNYYNNWSTGNTMSWSYTTTVYMYQLVCPRCFETNWGEIDKIVTCKGKLSKRACGAKLKAIKEKVDFEVPVG